jgi:voltage-gated potassium channel
LVLPHYAYNALLTLVTRQMNPSLRIVAGADAVVCPHETGGTRMAIASMSPNVLDFMEMADGDQPGIRVDEIQIDEKSALCGTSPRDSPIRSKLGLAVVALRKAGGTMRFSPEASEQIDANDILVIIGPPDELGTLRELTAAPT